MASAQADAIKDLYRGWVAAMAADPEMSMDDLRLMFEHWGDVTAEPGSVDYVEVDAGGVAAMWAIPKGCSDKHVVIGAHGGGYAAGSMYSHRKVFGHIAKAIGCKALILHYRRSPEDPHPAQNEDAVNAYKWLLEQGIAPDNICTTGDSAGGALCTSMVIAMRDQGLPLPAAILPISPFYDMELTGETLASNAESDVLVKKELAAGMIDMFLAGGSLQDPLANPLYADLSGLPPIYIQVGGDECLLDDSVRFEKKASDSGVDVKLDVFPEMQHVFHFLAGVAPEADQAIAQMAAWVRPKLGL